MARSHARKSVAKAKAKAKGKASNSGALSLGQAAAEPTKISILDQAHMGADKPLRSLKRRDSDQQVRKTSTTTTGR